MICKQQPRSPNPQTILNLFLSLIFFLSFTGISLSQQLRINEFLAINDDINSDEDGENSDWLELYNGSGEDINLNNWYLTDDRDEAKWQFPNITIQNRDYLLIFASDKNRTAGELHTNFKLSGGGEYLALIDPDGEIISEFDPFPEQFSNISYAWDNESYAFSETPTPGSENQINNDSFLSPPTFGTPHGFYTSAFSLELKGNGDIYYTLDASEPTTSSTPYTDPISIDKSTVVRTIVVSDNVASASNTSTYLFIDDIINQPNDPDGYPAEWGPYYSLAGNAIGDYEMDPEITENPQYKDLMDDALLALPVVSIVTSKDNLFSSSTDPEEGGIYYYTGAADEGGPELGTGWERPASMEFFDAEGIESFQINCGLRLHGGHSRRIEKTPKHSFRAAFRSEYGKTKLKYDFFGGEATESINTIVFRAGYGNSLLHSSSNERSKFQLIRDIWSKDTQREMGHLSAHGRFVHLFLNGLYWGIYNPTERMDKAFAEEYYDGDEEDFDIIKDYTSVVEGNINAWNQLLNLSESAQNEAVYQQILGNNLDGTPSQNFAPLLDVDNFIDYMLINYYGANWDWDSHNWAAIRNRENPEKGFQFFSWDAEHNVEGIYANNLSTNNAGRPTQIFNNLIKNSNFKLRVGDRVHKHFFNGGTLTPAMNIARWKKHAEILQMAVIAETARWGDYRRDVHPWSSGPFELYDKSFWEDELSYLIRDYFPLRGNVFIEQLKQKGFYPNISAPTFYINQVPAAIANWEGGDNIEIVSNSEGVIYFTVDGTDPADSEMTRQYVQPITIDGKIELSARVYLNLEWSALSTQTFDTDLLNLLSIKDSETNPVYIHPNPAKDNSYLKFDLSGNDKVQIDLFDSSGKWIRAVIEKRQLRAGNHEIRMSTQNLKPGLYILKLRSDFEHSTSLKLIVK